jgi:O-methyltransferase involved in polyketide biosynthesis
VTTYLTRVANLATLAAITSCAHTESELVFSYLDQSMLDSDGKHSRMQQARAQVAAVGEPWVSGFHPHDLPSDLHNAGLELIDDLGPAELAARYCSGRTDGLTPSPGSHVAHARVAA